MLCKTFLTGVTVICDRLCKKGSYSFSKFSTLFMHISSGFQAITFILHHTIVVCWGYILGPSFKVLPKSQVKLWDSKCVLLESAIRALFAEPVTYVFSRGPCFPAHISLGMHIFPTQALVICVSLPWSSLSMAVYMECSACYLYYLLLLMERVHIS